MTKRMGCDKNVRMAPFVKELEHCDPVRVFAGVAHLPYALFFDSADRGHQDARYSFVVSHPAEMIEAKNGRIAVTTPDGREETDGDPFTVIAERLQHYTAETLPGLPPFQGGLAGLFGYDLGRGIEALPTLAQDNSALPDLAVGIYDVVFAFDHHADKGWLISHHPTKHEHLLELTHATMSPDYAAPLDLDWCSNFSRESYMLHVQTIIDYIHEGDIFQANLAQRFDADLPIDFDPFAHYLRLRKVNAAPFGGYMNFGGFQISSASPERFLSCNNGHVQTKPIKGTRPASTPAQDLIGSEKDRAENTMIVDLLRNDLSKCCTPKSVDVTDLCALESFASVHHLVSTIRGELRADQSPIDLLRACFPGGSITGAPKIRAMEIIEELEPTRRGPYCGAMGYVGFDGAMDTNILIRSLVFEEGRVSLQSGGGIVADSDPAEEYEETLTKAAAMFQSFEGESANIPSAVCI